MYSFSLSGVSVKFCLWQCSQGRPINPFSFLAGSRQIPLTLCSHILSPLISMDIKGILV